MVFTSLCSGELPEAKVLESLRALQAEQFGGSREELRDAAGVALKGLKALFDAVRRAETASKGVKALAGNGHGDISDADDDDVDSEEDTDAEADALRTKSRKRQRPIGSGRLDELPVEGFDSEQLWAMLDMENKPTMRYLEEMLTDLETANEQADGDLTLLARTADDEDEEVDDDDDDDDGDLAAMLARARSRKNAEKTKTGAVDEDDDSDAMEDDDDDEEGEQEEEEEEKESDTNAEELDVPTEMDDDFFTFADMEKFTSSMEDDDARMKLKQLKREEKEKESDAKDARTSLEEDDYSDDGAGDHPEADDDSDADDDKDDDDDSGVDLDAVNDEDEDDSSDEMARHATFSDFWGKAGKPKPKKTPPTTLSKKKKKITKPDEDEEFDDVDDDNDDDDDEVEVEEEEEEEEGSDAEAMEDVDGEETAAAEPDVRLSTHEKQQLALREQIQEFEDELVGEKNWELTGETRGRDREKNELLEKGADLEVDYIARPAPAITEEVTRSLEDTIRQRILDADFDDVERKLPMEKDADYRPKAELSMEKSKVGLGEEYANAYEQQVLGHASETDTARTEAHQELHSLFTSLCHKLDSLSNFHYTPKPPTLEGAVEVKNTAAIEMEEAMPVAVSASAQAAPEQVLAVKKGREGVGKTREEMDQDERKALRQATKTAKRKRKRMRDAEKRIVSKLNPGLGNKHAKRAAAVAASGAATPGTGGDDTKWTKSSTFFAKMQQNAADDQTGGHRGKAARQSRDDKLSNASRTAQLRL